MTDRLPPPPRPEVAPPQPLDTSSSPQPLSGTNSLAVAALICGFVLPLLGIIFGHIAIGQIRRMPQQGREMAIAGLILGYVSTAIILIYAVTIVISIAVTSGRNFIPY